MCGLHSQCAAITVANAWFSTAQFEDEGAGVIRDHRWLKIPAAKIGGFLLRTLVRAVTEKNPILESHLWARLEK